MLEKFWLHHRIFQVLLHRGPSKNSSAPIEMFLATVGQTLYRDFWATLYMYTVLVGRPVWGEQVNLLYRYVHVQYIADNDNDLT